MEATVRSISLGERPRVICISDIHGELDLFRALLEKVEYRPGADALVLLGDLFLKGSKPPETLDYVIELSRQPYVHVLKGNCDFSGDTWMTAEHTAWLDGLPAILEAEDYIFVHAGLGEGPLGGQDLRTCVQTPAFMERGLAFDKWVLHGHWPVENYCHGIACCNPIADGEKKIIAIDGGNVVKSSGQLNAFIIENGSFSFESVDRLESFTAVGNQLASGGFNITWQDRFVEALEEKGDLTLVRHLTTGHRLWMPTAYLWRDDEGNLVGARNGTDYLLPTTAGERLKLVERFDDRALAKKDGVVGWVML